MASRTKSHVKSISKRTKEQEVFASRFADLREAIVPSINALTAKLYSAQLIDRETRDCEASPSQKAERVLRCVEKRIDRNRKTFHEFVNILDDFSSLSDIVRGLRESTVVSPQRAEDTSDGHSRLYLGTPNPKTAPDSHGTPTMSPEQFRSMVGAFSAMMLKQEAENTVKVDSSPTDGTAASEMLPGIHYFRGNRQHQGTYLSEAAALRHAAQDMPSLSLALADEDVQFKRFQRYMGDANMTPENSLPESTQSTIEEKGHVQFSRLDVNFDVTASLSSTSSCLSDDSSLSRSSSDSGDFEDTEENKIIEKMKELMDLYQGVKRTNHNLKQKLKEKEKRLKCDRQKLKSEQKKRKDQTKELKLTREEALEKGHRCKKLEEKISQQEIQIQLLKRQHLSALKECKRLNDHLEAVTEQALKDRISLKKYEKISEVKDDGYYEEYCKAMKENNHLHDQLKECKATIELLEQQVDYLLKQDSIDDRQESSPEDEPNKTLDSKSICTDSKLS